MNIEKLVLGMVNTNCYLLWNNKKEAIIIDPASNYKLIKDTIEDKELYLKYILLTHGHFDHIGAVNELSEKYNAKIYAHEQEKEILYKANLNYSTAIGKDISVIADLLLKDNDIINILDYEIKVIHTPGHTKGSVCYLFIDENILFSGDTLFKETVGRWDLPTGEREELVLSINNKLMLLDDDVVVYPGHEDETSIGHERNNNEFIKYGE